MEYPMIVMGENRDMKLSSKRAAEPSILVDSRLAASAWSTEETVLFDRSKLVPPAPVRPRPLWPAVVGFVLIVGAAVAIRLLLR
jgi:hypothetical protein